MKRESRIQRLVSSHLLTVSAVPILLKITETVIELIPNRFFKDLFDLLKTLHLIAIWHYLVILTSIAIGIALICIIQKKYSARKTRSENG